MHDPHDAFERHDRGLISRRALVQLLGVAARSEEHTSEL